MKSKKLTLVCSVCLIVILISSILLSACSKEPAAPATPAVPEAETFEWRLHTHVTAGAATYPLVEFFAEEIETATGGRMKMTVYPGGALVPSAEHLEAVAARTIDAAYSCGVYWQGTIPECGLEWGLPTTVRELTDMYDLWYNHGVLELLREAYARHDTYLIDIWGAGGPGLWATKPVREVADLQGLKVRAIGATAKLLDSLGASTTYIPHDESYTALQLGTIDGYSTSPFLYRDVKHYEVCKYMMVPQIGRIGIGVLFANPAAWSELPEDIQAVIHLAMGRLFIENGTVEVEQSDIMLMNEVPALGGEIVNFSEDLQKALTVATVDYLYEFAAENADTNVPAIVDKIVEYITLQGYL